ncbi:MAG: hypothetical protein JNK05_17850 [Myxococcales bacterium]|nr:hypothetical protein [Myxococcales bacterium]
MNTDELAELVRASSDTKAPPAARAFSARELLSKLEGAERAELEHAMRSKDLDAVRAIMARHHERAAVAIPTNAPGVSAPVATMSAPRGWTSKRSTRSSGGRFTRSNNDPPTAA